MRVIIAGGRDFSDYQLLKDRVNYYMSNASDVVVICGEAKGADLLGKKITVAILSKRMRELFLKWLND